MVGHCQKCHRENLVCQAIFAHGGNVMNKGYLCVWCAFEISQNVLPCFLMQPIEPMSKMCDAALDVQKAPQKEKTI